MVRKPHFRLRILAVVLAVCAAFVTLATLGVVLPSDPFGSIPLDGPTVADSNGRHTAIVDSESRRLLILDKNHRLTGVVNCNSLTAPIEAITDVCVSGDTIYVAGVRYQKDSNFVAKERVVAYNSRGTSEQIVYDLEPDQVGMTPCIQTMDKGDGDNGAYIVLCRNSYDEEFKTSLDLVFVSRDETEYLVDETEYLVDETTDLPEVFDVGYSAKKDGYATISSRGVIDDNISAENENDLSKNCAFTTLDVADNGDVFLFDDISKTVYRLSGDGEFTSVTKGEGFGGIHVNGQNLTISNRENNYVYGRDPTGSNTYKLSAVTCSTSLRTWSTAVLVSRVYISVFLLATISLYLFRRIAKRNYEGMGAMMGSIAVVFVVSLAIAYISYGSYTAMQETRAKEINTFADYLSMTSGAMSKGVESCADRSVFRQSSDSYKTARESLSEALNHAAPLCFAATQNGIGTYVAIYGEDEQGLFYLYDSAGEHVMGTEGVSSADKSDVERIFSTNDSDSLIRTGRTLYDASQYRLVKIPSSDGKGTAGVIEIGSRRRTFEASIASDQIERIIALLVMVLVIYLTYVELRSCAHCLIEFQSMKHHHDAIAILTRPFSFFITLLSSIDAVMTTLIARSLLSESGIGSTSVLLAIPSVMLGVGLVLGQATYALVGSRYLIRTLMKRGAALMAIAAIVTGLAVLWGNFWFYCAAKLLMTVPFGLLYSLSYSLPRRADSDEVRELAASGIKRTDTSAAALGTVLGGYVAQNLGNAWVYVLVAGVSVIVFAMATSLLPRTKHPLEKESKKADTQRQALRMLLKSKTTLPIIFFLMLPGVLAAGYNSFMFPLFTADLGLATSSINNLFVLGQLVVFVSIGAIEHVEARFDKWRVAGTAVALLGAVFLLFSLNSTLVWAVVTIALVGVLCKANDGWKAMWVRSAKSNGIATGLATGEMFAVRSVLLVVQPLMLGSLLMVGDRTAVSVLGIICSLCSVAFYFTTRHTALAPSDE